MDRIAVIARLQQFEGCIGHMYKCTRGEVTIGIGHALPTAADAMSLSWQIDGAPAPADRVTPDYEAVATAAKGRAAATYAHLTQCRLTAEDAQKLVAADVQSCEQQ